MIFPSFDGGGFHGSIGEPFAVFIFLPGVNLEDGILPSLALTRLDRIVVVKSPKLVTTDPGVVTCEVFRTIYMAYSMTC